MTHAMVKGSNIQLKTVAVRAVLCWAPGARCAGRRCLRAAARRRTARCARTRTSSSTTSRGTPPGWSGTWPRSRSGRACATRSRRTSGPGPHVDRVLLAASADGGTFADVRELRLLLLRRRRPGRRRGRGRTAAAVRHRAGDRRRDGDDLRRAVPAREAAGSSVRWARATTRGWSGWPREYGITVDESEAGRRRRPRRSAGTQRRGSQLRRTVPAPPRPRSAPPEAATVPAFNMPPSTADPDADFPVVGARGRRGGGRARGPAAQSGYGYPQPPQQPPATQPAYGYPQPAYGYPQPDPDFTLPPQGPQFQNR